MRTPTKLLMAALTTILLLAVAVSAATATRLRVDHVGWRAIFNPLVLSESGLGVEIRCHVTLEGTFHENTITKTVGSLIGFVTRAIVQSETCTGGSARVLSETLPWHVQYREFTGTLPNITSVGLTLINASFAVNAFGFVNCLYRTEARHPAVGHVILNGSGTATGLRADETFAIPRKEGLCGEGRFSGTSSLTVLGETGAITVTLI